MTILNCCEEHNWIVICFKYAILGKYHPSIYLDIYKNITDLLNFWTKLSNHKLEHVPLPSFPLSSLGNLNGNSRQEDGICFKGIRKFWL